ncbi:uncharacterized protein LOC136029495 isoform X3 [Artemia franciscana]|uniref:uncharacterized protein LOC136029495 isoform X3 n=1 Tax=Artemia franciscana TaxID=6661 RepID=UPI0032DA9CB9
MMFDYLCHSEITSKKHYESYVFQRIGKSRKLLEKCAEEAKKCSALKAKGNSDEEEDSKKNQSKNMDELTRKKIAKDMTRTIKNIVCQKSSQTTLPAPGLSLPGPEMTLSAPGPTLSAPGPTLPARLLCAGGHKLQVGE